MGTFFLSFLRAWFGSEEYYEARHKRARTWSFPMRFWGRLIIAALGLCFFLWQQITEPSQWWGSDTFATLVLGITASQAAGPFFYLLCKFTLKFFLTKHYREALGAGKFYFTLKSALCILLTTVLSVLAAYGFLGTRWYVKPFAFFLTFPVAWFLVILPALNWAGVRWIGFPKTILKHSALAAGMGIPRYTSQQPRHRTSPSGRSQSPPAQGRATSPRVAVEGFRLSHVMPDHRALSSEHVTTGAPSPSVQVSPPGHQVRNQPWSL